MPWYSKGSKKGEETFSESERVVILENKYSYEYESGEGQVAQVVLLLGGKKMLTEKTRRTEVSQEWGAAVFVSSIEK